VASHGAAALVRLLREVEEFARVVRTGVVESSTQLLGSDAMLVSTLSQRSPTFHVHGAAGHSFAAR
jgi:hypothetical protein